MKTPAAISLAIAALASNALAGLTLVHSGTPTVAPSGTTSAFNAVGTYQSSNFKSYVDAAGQTRVTAGSAPAFWNVQRSFEVLWNSTTKQVTFKVYSDANYSTLNWTLTRNPVIAAGHGLSALSIGARLNTTNNTIAISGVEFDGGAGFTSVPTANVSYSGNANFNNYYLIQGGSGNFSLRGKVVMSGTSLPTSSDNTRFFVNGLEAQLVPLPPAAWAGLSTLGGIAGLAVARRRKQVA